MTSSKYVVSYREKKKTGWGGGAEVGGNFSPKRRGGIFYQTEGEGSPIEVSTLLIFNYLCLTAIQKSEFTLLFLKKQHSKSTV